MIDIPTQTPIGIFEGTTHFGWLRDKSQNEYLYATGTQAQEFLSIIAGRPAKIKVTVTIDDKRVRAKAIRFCNSTDQRIKNLFEHIIAIRESENFTNQLELTL